MNSTTGLGYEQNQIQYKNYVLVKTISLCRDSIRSKLKVSKSWERWRYCDTALMAWTSGGSTFYNFQYKKRFSLSYPSFYAESDSVNNSYQWTFIFVWFDKRASTQLFWCRHWQISFVTTRCRHKTEVGNRRRIRVGFRTPRLLLVVFIALRLLIDFRGWRHQKVRPTALWPLAPN